MSAFALINVFMLHSLLSAVYCVSRSLLAVGALIGFAYGGLTGEAHSQHTQEILFSIFCALVVATSYHLSRSSSDPTVMFSLIKRQLLEVVPTTIAAAAASDLDAEVGGGDGTAAGVDACSAETAEANNVR
jgi:hypothetical protein